MYKKKGKYEKKKVERQREGGVTLSSDDPVSIV